MPGSHHDGGVNLTPCLLHKLCPALVFGQPVHSDVTCHYPFSLVDFLGAE